MPMMRGARALATSLSRGSWGRHVPASSRNVLQPRSRGIVDAEAMGSVVRVDKEHWSSFMFGRERQLLIQVVRNAEEGNIESVLEAMDSLWTKTLSMKDAEASWRARGDVIMKVMKEKAPKRCVEIGTYCGYSALMIARELPEDGFLVSVEVDPLFAAIATKIVEHAGVAHKVKVLMGDMEKNAARIPAIFKAGNGQTSSADFILCDHNKELFVPDLKRLEEAGVTGPGTVVMGDTTVYPGFVNEKEGTASSDLLTYFATNPRYRIQSYIGTCESSGITVSEWTHLP